MPSMVDPNFARTLTYICEHGDQGAMGVVVNRPIEMTLGSLFAQVDLNLQSVELAERPVFYGGPVRSDRGFVLHSPAGQWSSSLKVNDRLALTTSRDVLEAIGAGTGPARMLVTLGYAGWAAGQLEHELAQNAWLTVAAQPDILFDLPAEQRLSAAMELLGLDFARLQDVAGHA